ncbi:hypothetical protein IFR05_011472 [Cadophora sp. M221]|nr:hypothetical protein IFR05_011472 [Cadophora sp. M221]
MSTSQRFSPSLMPSSTSHTVPEEPDQYQEIQRQNPTMNTQPNTAQQEFKQPERRVKPPPPPQTCWRAFLDRQVGFIMKVLGVI